MSTGVSGPYGGTPLPPPVPGWTPPPPPAPIDRVRGPAIGMMVAAGLVAIYVLGMGGFYAVMMFIGESQASGVGPRPNDLAPMIVTGTVAVVMALIALSFAGFIGFGAWKMMRLQSYPIALAAAIATFVIGLPCSCCAINTVVAWPIAIWAVVVLSDSAVKAAFNAPPSIASTFD